MVTQAFFFIKDYTNIFVLLIVYVFNLSLS